jgi:hypothetical protein
LILKKADNLQKQIEKRVQILFTKLRFDDSLMNTSSLPLKILRLEAIEKLL